MSIENKVPMSDFDRLTEVKDSAEIIALQDNDNARLPLQSIISKIIEVLNSRFIHNSKINQPNGVAGLNSNGKVPLERIEGIEIDTNLIPIDLFTPAPTRNGVFVPTEAGVYTNFGNLEVTADELENSLVYFYYIGGVFTKQVKASTSVDKVEPNNANAVSSQAVYNYAIQNVNTIADLRNLEGKIDQKINLLGYYEAGDKPSLLYQWVDNNDNIIDDGGSIIISGYGHWKALFVNKEVNVKDFGAIGDGISDDTENIQKTWDFANGYTVIMQGYFLVTNTLIIPKFDDNHSIQMVIDGKGKLSGGGQPDTYNSGISQILYNGEEGTECIISEANQTWVSFKTIFIRNISERVDVDGIKMKHFKSNLCQELYVFGFRDNFRIEGDFYYTQFNKCSFSHAIQNNFYAHGLANSALFLDCRFSNGLGVGFNGNRLGDEVNFQNCYFEGNKGHGAIFRNTRLININGGYIEHNGYESDYQGKPSVILVTPYTNNNGVEVTLNINQAYIMTSDNTDVVCVGSNTNVNYGNIIVNITSCTIPQSNIKKDYDSTDKTYLIRSITINKTKVNISNNNYQIIEDKQIMNLVSGIITNYLDIKIDNDLLYYKYFNTNSTLINKLGVAKIFPPHFNKTIGNTDTADSFLDIDDVDNTNRLIVRLFRFTRALFRRVSVYDGSNEVIYLDAQEGKVKCSKLGLGNNTEILNSTVPPEGNVTARQGSICVYENGDNSELHFKKTGTSNIGWVQITT